MRGPTTPVPIRLDDGIREKIRRTASKLGTNASALIRFAIIAQIDEIERTGELRIKTPQEGGK